METLDQPHEQGQKGQDAKNQEISQRTGGRDDQVGQYFFGPPVEVGNPTQRP